MIIEPTHPIIVINSRLHDADVAGALDLGGDYAHLVLPTTYREIVDWFASITPDRVAAAPEPPARERLTDAESNGSIARRLAEILVTEQRAPPILVSPPGQPRELA